MITFLLSSLLLNFSVPSYSHEGHINICEEFKSSNGKFIEIEGREIFFEHSGPSEGSCFLSGLKCQRAYLGPNRSEIKCHVDNDKTYVKLDNLPVHQTEIGRFFNKRMIPTDLCDKKNAESYGFNIYEAEGRCFINDFKVSFLAKEESEKKSNEAHFSLYRTIIGDSCERAYLSDDKRNIVCDGSKMSLENFKKVHIAFSSQEDSSDQFSEVQPSEIEIDDLRRVKTINIEERQVEVKINRMALLPGFRPQTWFTKKLVNTTPLGSAPFYVNSNSLLTNTLGPCHHVAVLNEGVECDGRFTSFLDHAPGHFSKRYNISLVCQEGQFTITTGEEKQRHVYRTPRESFDDIAFVEHYPAGTIIPDHPMTHNYPNRYRIGEDYTKRYLFDEQGRKYRDQDQDGNRGVVGTHLYQELYPFAYDYAKKCCANPICAEKL